ncbi:MAG: ABC transporter permease [Roseburia sp.]
MNIFSKITLRNLRKNRTRTLVTIIGIILSTAMFTAVTSTITSMQQYLIDYYAYEDGTWHICYNNMNIADVTNLETQEQVDHLDTLQEIGFSDLVDSANDYKPYIHVAAMSKNFSDTMPVHLLEGRMPENSHEIILPEHLDYNGGITYHIGDKLNLDLSNRVYDNTILDNHTPYSEGEELSLISSETYTVVGFYERPSFEDFSAPGYTALTISDSSVGQDRYDTYVTLTNLYLTEDFIYSYEYPDSATMNYDYLRLFSASNENAFNSVLYSLAVILIAIIMFGSVSLIYNSFSISVNERAKQFGILSSVGATHRQLRASVLTEGLFLSIVGIPLGILSGLLGMYITFYFLGKRMSESFTGNSDLAVSLHPSPMGILITICIALITILISAYIPAARAMRRTAIESIRQNDTIKLRANRVKVSPLTTKLFGLSGMLATKNYKRNRKKYRATVFSLFISIVLFISSSSFCAYLMKSTATIYEEEDYDLAVSIFPDENAGIDSEKLLADMESIDSVTQCLLCSNYWGNLTLNRSALSAEFVAYYGSSESEDLGNTDDSRQGISVQVRFLTDDAFRDYLSQLKVDADSYFVEGKPKAILINNIKIWDMDHYLLCDVVDDISKADLTLAIPETEVPVACDVATDIVPALLYGGPQFPYLLMPQSQMDYFFSEDDMPAYMLTLYTSDHKDASEKLYAYFDNIGANVYIQDIVNEVEESRTMMLIIQVFCYGFIVLISLIAMANVFNTISTNVSLRQKEFAMLRSVGMDDRAFYRMMNFECLLYGFKGLLYGLPAALLVTYLIYLSISDGLEMTFFIPWYSLMITIVGVFLIVFATMLYSMKKLQKESTVEVLRNDNI